MAKPDLDDGFLRIAYELECAILTSGLGMEGYVIWEVFAQIYGWGKRLETHLSQSDIAGRAGLDKGNVGRSLRKLVKAGILVKVEGSDQVYRFVKDYERWELGMTPVQRARWIGYVRNAPVLAKSYGNPADAETVVKSDYQSESADEVAVVNSDYASKSAVVKFDYASTSGVVKFDYDVKDTVPPPYVSPPQRSEEEVLCVSPLPPIGGDTHTGGVTTDLTTEPESSLPNGSLCRSPEDAALVRQAASMLRNNIQTEHLGIDLLRHDTLPRCMEIAGWKFLRAAETILDPSVPDRKRRSWPYFLAVAANLTEADRNPSPAPRSQRNGVPSGPALPPPAASAAPGFRINPPKRKKDS